MAASLSRLETAVSNIDQAGFFIGYAVSEADAANASYVPIDQGHTAPDGNPAKKMRLDFDPSPASPVTEQGNEVSGSAGIPSLSSAIHDSNGGSPALSQNLEDCCTPSSHGTSHHDDDKPSKDRDFVSQPVTDGIANSTCIDSTNVMEIGVSESEDSRSVQVKLEHNQTEVKSDCFQDKIDDAVETDNDLIEPKSELVENIQPAVTSALMNNRREKELYDSEQMLNLHDNIIPLRTLDQFACGGRFILNETDRLARVRFETSGEKELKDAGSICQLAVADLLRGHTKLSPINPSQERCDHVAQDLSGDFRISIHASASTKQPDDATFLDEIRQRCCDVFNIPSLSLRRRHLRIYSKGGYCRPSMSSPRVPQRTIATVIVCLPSPFTGGKLVVSHLKIRKSFSFCDRSAFRDSVQWAAFYSDCEYEIKKVRSGHQALIIYDACVESEDPQHRRQVYKQIITRPILPAPIDEISSLVEAVSSFLSSAPVVGLFTWYSYTLSALNKAPLTLKGLDRHIYDALSTNFRIVLLPVVVRLPYEDDSSRNIRVAAFTRDDIEYMEGVADKPAHEELEPFEGVIPFPLRSDIETFEFCANDEVETTYFYSAMVILPFVSVPIAEA